MGYTVAAGAMLVISIVASCVVTAGAGTRPIEETRWAMLTAGVSLAAAVVLIFVAYLKGEFSGEEL